MPRFRCAIGPMTDCVFRDGVRCRRTRIIVGMSSQGQGGAIYSVCKMRERRSNPLYQDGADLTQPPDVGWDGLLDFRCRCIPNLSPEAEAILDEVYNKRGTEEEPMLNCVLDREERQVCVSYVGQGKCKLNAISCERLKGTTVCHQYKKEPRPCDVCGVDTIPTQRFKVTHHGTGECKTATMCTNCFDIYESLTTGQDCSYGHDRAMGMLKDVVYRGRDNLGGLSA